KIGKIEYPGTVEGGDILLSERVAFIGQSGRTNPEGAEQIARILRAIGFETRITRVPSPFLHLGGAMTLLGPDSILCVNNLFPQKFLSGFQCIEVPDTGFISGNVIPLSDRQAIADRSNHPVIETLQLHDFTVFPLDLSEFVKGRGGPSCLILEVK
ncbi:MAG: hypothetical protein JXA23_03020, partial [Bacteroidales bacterium]|nr:hypothetical protein [Bacteroidales bacterium]